MKRASVCFIFAALVLFAFPKAVSALEVGGEYERELVEGTEIIESSLPASARDYLDGGVLKSPDDLSESLKNLLGSLGASLTGRIKSLSGTVSSIVAALIICSAAGGATRGGTSSSSRTVTALCAAASSASVCVCAAGLASEAVELAKHADSFFSGFVPLLAGVLVSQGGAALSAVFSSSIAAVCAASSALLSSLARPAVGVIAGLSAVSALNGGAYSSLVSGMKRAVMWSVGIATTFFIGFTGLKAALAASTDSLSMRTAGYLIGSSVPIVGASVNEAMSTVRGSLAVVKTGLGSAGILGICAMYIPPLLGSVAASAAVSLCSIAADIMGLAGAAKSISMMKCALDIITALIAFSFMAAAACTAMMLRIGVQ